MNGKHRLAYLIPILFEILFFIEKPALENLAKVEFD